MIKMALCALALLIILTLGGFVAEVLRSWGLGWSAPFLVGGALAAVLLWLFTKPFFWKLLK